MIGAYMRAASSIPGACSGLFSGKRTVLALVCCALGIQSVLHGGLAEPAPVGPPQSAQPRSIASCPGGIDRSMGYKSKGVGASKSGLHYPQQVRPMGGRASPFLAESGGIP